MARSHDSSDSAGGASFTPWLREQLRNHTNVALQSFEKLCERCDEDFLTVRFAMLHSFRPIDARPDGQLNLAKAKKIAKRAEALLDDIARLKRDPVIEFLRKLGQFGQDDFLSGQFFTDGFRFDGLKHLPGLFRRLGPHCLRNPEREQLISEIEEHIRQSFGQPRNALLAHVLDAVVPHEGIHTEDTLKTASFRRRNTRKR